MSNDCVFCQIVAGASPASTFYEDEMTLGLMTIGPVTTGHAMIIPKQHFEYLNEMDEATGRHFWTVTQRTAEALRHSGVRCEGVNLFLADGEAAFQEIFHVHMHVFPRYSGDAFKRSLPTGVSIRRVRTLIPLQRKFEMRMRNCGAEAGDLMVGAADEQTSQCDAAGNISYRSSVEKGAGLARS